MELAMLQKKWPEVLVYMREAYEISNVAKKTWLDPVKVVSVDAEEGVIYLMTSDADILPFLRKKYEPKFQEAINTLFQVNYTVRILA